jgi:hypothetical protein
MTEQHGENPAEPTGEATPPPAAPTPPPAAPTPPPAAQSAPAGSAGGQQYDFDQAKQTLQGAHPYDLGIIGAGAVAFIASLLPFYTISVSAGGLGGASGSVSAWHGFFGWFAVLVALVTSAAVALALFNVVKLPMPVHQIAVAGFGLALLCLLLALFVDPNGGCGGVGGIIQCDIGRGFGYWLALIAVLAGAVLSVLRMRESTASGATA